MYLHVYRQDESATENVYAMVVNGGGSSAPTHTGGSVVADSYGDETAGPVLTLVASDNGADHAIDLPCHKLSTDEAQPFVNCVPLLDLKVAAGGFSPPREVNDAEHEWVALPGHVRPAKDVFVAQV